jgi:chromodomain-helicase-DNA-binding protein 1
MSMAIEHSPDSEDDEPQSPMLPQRSESELSDVNDIPATSHHTATLLDEPESDDDAMHNMATSDVDAEADADVADGGDAEFEEDVDVSSQENGLTHNVSSSEAESSSGKRRNDDVDDEEYMKQNPELYGLRRSVSLLTTSRCFLR